MEKLIYITKNIEDEDTGANCNFHILNQYEVDIENRNIDLLFSSYVSKKMYENGRSALSQYYRIQLRSIDFDAEKPLDVALKEVVKAKPKDWEDEENTRYHRDRYYFADGKVQIEEIKEKNEEGEGENAG